MIKAFLFDMDGVLYDSMPGHVQAWRDVMLEFGIPSNLDDFYLLEGRTGSSTIDALFIRHFGHGATDEEKKNIYRLKTERFIKMAGYNQAMPGSIEVLQKVKNAGLMRVIVTGSGQKSLFENIDNHFPGYFNRSLMVTAYDVMIGKPHPEPYLMGLKKAGITANEAIVVENAPLGVEAAKAAGIFTIAVNTGPLNNKILQDAGADVIYGSMTELSENIEKYI
ncbi:MAG: HAD-IA family hydrolase [Dysgonamonadaceae bacterium]|jgi:HAD superfamily hydrolase (TIGR01509 family)|nr:HAD-IA family hydrolase [Dysgonamonadaceae bacterium]